MIPSNHHPHNWAHRSWEKKGPFPWAGSEMQQDGKVGCASHSRSDNGRVVSLHLLRTPGGNICHTHICAQLPAFSGICGLPKYCGFCVCVCVSHGQCFRVLTAAQNKDSHKQTVLQKCAPAGRAKDLIHSSYHLVLACWSPGVRFDPQLQGGGLFGFFFCYFSVGQWEGCVYLFAFTLACVGGVGWLLRNTSASEGDRNPVGIFATVPGG